MDRKPVGCLFPMCACIHTRLGCAHETYDMKQEHNIKPFVNFPEFKKDKEVLKTWNCLVNLLFPKRERKTPLTWEQAEQKALEKYPLNARQTALFLGHSERWAGTSLT